MRFYDNQHLHMDMIMNRPIHFEILSDNPKEISRFYASVFDWQIANWDGPQSYWLVTTGKEGTPGINGGIMEKNLPQAVINTIEVTSLQDTINRVNDNGGKLLMGPNEIPGIGKHAYCEAPDGTIFGILQPVD
jgi:predicted enzyme related to lactoylglutathione lyase